MPCGGVGRGFGDLDQFLVAGQFARQQRIGEDLRSARSAAGLALQFARIDACRPRPA
jgi:hypothetical protein